MAMLSPSTEPQARRLSLQQVHDRVTRQVLPSLPVATGTALSPPVPVGSPLGLLLGWFVYGRPTIRGTNSPMVGPPRCWLLLRATSAEIVLFADCRVHDFSDSTSDDGPWPYEGPPATTLDELVSLSSRLLQSLQVFLDNVFAHEEPLPGEQRAALAEYVELLHRLTPAPLHSYLRELSPGFWEWAERNGVSA